MRYESLLLTFEVCAGPEAMAFVMVWLRLSTARLLPWYKNSSYQSKDIAHVQKSIAQNMADKVSPSPALIGLDTTHRYSQW